MFIKAMDVNSETFIRLVVSHICSWEHLGHDNIIRVIQSNGVATDIETTALEFDKAYIKASEGEPVDLAS